MFCRCHFCRGKLKPLVNMDQMLKKARANHYAVAQININNLEWIKAVLNAAQKSNTPVILGVSAGAGKYMHGFGNVVDMVKNTIAYNKITIPVALHLDHGSFEACIECLNVGFSSVMFDGSRLPINENIAKTNIIVKLAKKHHASVEAEVGGIGGSEDGTVSNGELASVEECSLLVKKTKICCLAAGIGNIHGIYPKNWKGLNFKRLQKITEATDGIPLVLHGGTGIPEKQIKEAISLGVCKINVNTECQLSFAAATRKYITAKKDLDLKKKGFDPRKLLAPGVEAIEQTCFEKFTMFGSVGKA